MKFFLAIARALIRNPKILLLDEGKHLFLLLNFRAAMAEWLRCSAHIHKVLCSNLGTISYGMTLDKSLAAVCLGSPVR
jgi:ABC-type molybdenum transport system ATPase subunit/photorepair protein PhrA